MASVSTRKIYLISHDQSYALLLQGISKKFFPLDHFQVEKSVETALEFLKRGAADIILFDLSIPSDAKGLDIFFSLRSRARSIPIVVLCPNEDEGLILKTISFGAQDGILKKESRDEEVAKVINRTLARAKAHGEYCVNLLIDQVSGLNNRAGFINIAEQQVRLISRSKKGMVFFNIKIVNLSDINQSFDFNEGNRVLSQFASILQSSFRKTDILARYRGDQFAVCAVDSAKENIEIMVGRFMTNLKFYNDNMPDYYKIKVKVGAITIGMDNILSVEDSVQLAGENII